jgi:hypothetical protein
MVVNSVVLHGILRQTKRTNEIEAGEIRCTGDPEERCRDDRRLR